MPNEIINRFSAWLAKFRADLRLTGWRVVLLVPFLVFVVQVFAGEAVAAGGRAVWHVLGEVVKRPVGVTGLVFFALLFLLAFRAYWETRPQTAKGKALLQVEILKLNLQVAEDQHTEDQRQLRERDATIKGQAQTLADCQAHDRASFEQLAYRDRLIEPPPLNAANYAVMFARIEEMKPTMEAAAKAALQVWAYFWSQIATVAGKDSALAELVEYVNDDAIVPVKRAYRLLEEQMMTQGDPRPALAVFHARYCDLRRWILRYEGWLHQNLYTAAGSPEWYTADTQFFKDVEQCFKMSIFAEVRNAVKAYKENYGEQHPLPEPP